MLSRLPTMLLVMLFLASTDTSSTLDPNTPVNVEKTLFSSHEVLELTLSVDFDAMCRPNEVENCEYAPTTLNYTSEEGVDHEIPIEARVRGGWRARKDHCQVPPLFLRFSTVGVEGTPFYRVMGYNPEILEAYVTMRNAYWEQGVLEHSLIFEVDGAGVHRQAVLRRYVALAQHGQDAVGQHLRRSVPCSAYRRIASPMPWVRR